MTLSNNPYKRLMRSYQHKYTNAQLDFMLTYGDKNETQLTFLIYIYIYIYIYI